MKFNQKQRLTLMILLMVLFLGDTNAQCPNKYDTNTLDGQQEVDNFLTANPNCDFIDELELSGDVQDISGFLTLNALNYLYINDCPQLIDLSGFSNVDTIYQNLGFYNTEGLDNLCGLSSLKHIGNDLRLEGTKSILSLNGIESLAFIGDDITIEENLKLLDLDGLQNVEELAGNAISVKDNPVLENCCGIQNILNTSTNVEYLTIENNPAKCSNEEEVLNADCEFAVSECTTSSRNNDWSKSLKIYPNPANNLLRIENGSNSSIDQVALYNAYGQKVMQQSYPIENLAIGNIPNGFYVLEMSIDQQHEMYKIMIQH